MSPPLFAQRRKKNDFFLSLSLFSFFYFSLSSYSLQKRGTREVPPLGSETSSLYRGWDGGRAGFSLHSAGAAATATAAAALFSTSSSASASSALAPAESDAGRPLLPVPGPGRPDEAELRSQRGGGGCSCCCRRLLLVRRGPLLERVGGRHGQLLRRGAEERGR